MYDRTHFDGNGFASPNSFLKTCMAGLYHAGATVPSVQLLIKD